MGTNLKKEDGMKKFLCMIFAMTLFFVVATPSFAADAQTGNWLSWKDVKWEKQDVSTDDLLARTIFYKVGHHASHNATLVAALEKMNRPELVALIPVNKKDPNITKANGWKMPAKNLFK